MAKNYYIYKTKSYTITEKPIIASFKTKLKAQKFINTQKSKIYESPKAIIQKTTAYKEDTKKNIYESPKAIIQKTTAYKEDTKKNIYGKVDIDEEEGTFEIINSSGVGDTGEQLAFVEGYYITDTGKVYFKRKYDEDDTFIVKGYVADKEILKDKIDEKYGKLAEFD